MKKVILCFVIFVVTVCVFADSPFRFEPSDYINKDFAREHLDDIDELNFFGYSNLAYDLCDRIKTLNIDEKYLRLIKIHQSVALVRILVENGVIETIHQIPEESIGVFNHKAIYNTCYNIDLTEETQEKLKKSLYEYLTGNSNLHKIQLEKEGITLDNYEDYAKKLIPERVETIRTMETLPDDTADSVSFLLPEEYKTKKYTITMEPDISPKDLSKKHSILLAQVATISLAEKYPLTTEKLFNDYIAKYGIDSMVKIMVNYFINNKEYEKAVNLCEIAIKLNPDEALYSNLYKPDLTALIATAYAKSGQFEKAINTLDALLESNQISDVQKPAYYVNKILLYKFAAKEEEYKEEIENIKNEIIMLYKEKELYFFNFNLETLDYTTDSTGSDYITFYYSFSNYDVNEIENVWIDLACMKKNYYSFL